MLLKWFVVRRLGMDPEKYLDIKVHKKWGIPYKISGKVDIVLINPTRFVVDLSVRAKVVLEGMEFVNTRHSSTVPGRTRLRIRYSWSFNIVEWWWASIEALFSNQTEVEMSVSAGIPSKTMREREVLPVDW